MDKKVQKISKDLNTIIGFKLKEKFYDVAEELKTVLIEKYESELVGVVTDRDSKTNPDLYKDDFIDRLNKFTYVEAGYNHVKLIVPDMENFDFSGRLEVIESIMEGLAGLYVEMNGDDYKSVFNKAPINTKPFDDYISPKDRVYLVRYSNRIRSSEKKLKKRFVKYPFSNTPPIDILSEGEVFVSNNLDSWVDDVVSSSEKELANRL